jgi:hypothetical protein
MGVVLAVMQFVGGGFVGVVFDHDLLLDVMLSFFLVMELHTLLPFVYPRWPRSLQSTAIVRIRDGSDGGVWLI